MGLANQIVNLIYSCFFMNRVAVDQNLLDCWHVPPHLILFLKQKFKKNIHDI